MLCVVHESWSLFLCVWDVVYRRMFVLFSKQKLCCPHVRCAFRFRSVSTTTRLMWILPTDLEKIDALPVLLMTMDP